MVNKIVYMLRDVETGRWYEGSNLLAWEDDKNNGGSIWLDKYDAEMFAKAHESSPGAIEVVSLLLSELVQNKPNISHKLLGVYAELMNDYKSPESPVVGAFYETHKHNVEFARLAPTVVMIWKTINGYR